MDSQICHFPKSDDQRKRGYDWHMKERSCKIMVFDYDNPNKTWGISKKGIPTSDE